MVGASCLIDALGQEVIDQRVVADHLALLTKGLKNASALLDTGEVPAAVPPAGAADAAVLRHPSNSPAALEAGPPAAPDGKPPPAPPATTVTLTQPLAEEALHDGDTEGVQTAQVEANGTAAEESEREESAKIDDPVPEVVQKPKAPGELLLQLIRSFRGGMLKVDSYLRAAMFRSLRYLVRTSEDAEMIRKQRFGLFIALALAREQYELWERMQALKLVKQIMAVDSSRLPREVVRTVVAVSAHKEDNFRRVCLETLNELAVTDPRVVAHTNGFRVLLAAAIDPANQDLAEPMVKTLMSIAEDPATRRFVRPHLELHQLFTGFTDLDAPAGPERAHRWNATRKALVVAMRSWAGVHLLASDSRGLVTLMRLLRDPSASFSEDAGLQDSILETIIDIFDPLVGMGRVASSAEMGQKTRGVCYVDRLFIPRSGDPGTLYHKSPGPGLRTSKGSEPHNLLLSYATLLCAAFVHCGLIPSLTTLSISAGSEKLRAKAASLLVDVLHLCAMLLSQNQCTRLLSMPGLVEIAAESLTGSLGVAEVGVRSCHFTRSRASRASDLVRLLHRALGAGAYCPPTTYLGQHNQTDESTVTIGRLLRKVFEAESTIDSLDTPQSEGWERTGTLEQMRKELRVSIESTVEKSAMETQMNKSKVLATKDWTKWDWDVVDGIVQDILPHPPRLVDALRTKWIKRVSGFYRFVGASGTTTERGGGGGLHNMPWDPDHIRHISCAGRLYALLLQQQEGLHFLQTDPRGGVLQEIIKELQAVVTRRLSTGSGVGKFAGFSKVFDMDSCQRSLSAGYITLLFSVAAGTEAGRQLLSDEGLWKHVRTMGSQPELDYMSRLVLTKIDLASDKFFPRDVLEEWMTKGSSQLRLFSLNRIRTALRSATAANRRLRDHPTPGASSGSTTAHDFASSEAWCIEMLLAQINGDDPAVAQAALSVLEEATEDERCLRTLVLAEPELINKPGANDLLMRFLSIPEGILYLEEHGWVDQMVRDWKLNGRTTTYAESVDSKWQAHVNEVEDVEDTMDMERISKRGKDVSDSGVAIPIRTSDMSQDGLINGSWKGKGREMETLLSLPWNIDVMLSIDSAPSSGLPLKLDTFVVALPEKDTPGAKAAAAGTPGATKMVVRGILVDSDGKPTCHPLEAHLTLHARLCLGACAVDRRGDLQWQLNPTPLKKQTASFGRNRPSRISRSQRSPQRADDHSSYGGSTMYGGGQGMPDFRPGGELLEDATEMEHQLFWSTCRPHQRVAPPPLVINPGSDNGKDDSRSGLGTQTISPLSNSLQDDTLDADEQEAFSASEHVAGAATKSDGENREILQGRARSTAWGHERVVRVPNETARWVFTNQSEPDDTTFAQVVENASVTYLKAVEMTISMKDMGPAGIMLPPHLYGELAKTERGCEVLRTHGDLKNLLYTARNSAASSDDRKGALWAVAHVSSWPLGLALLEDLHGGVVGMLLNLCTSESHLSVWGTSFCVVSLMARTPRGRAAIRAAGWESARDPCTSAFLPQDPTILFQPVPWKYEGSLTRGLDKQPSDPVIETLRKDVGRTKDAEILDLVAKLSSHISRKEAMRKLSRMKKDKAHRESFTKSLPVFLLVHQLLADYSFSLPMRRHIVELFEQAGHGSSDWEPYVV